MTVRAKSLGLVTPPVGCEVSEAAICVQPARFDPGTDCCNPAWQVNGLSDPLAVSQSPQRFFVDYDAPGGLSGTVEMVRGDGGGTAAGWGNGVVGTGFIFSSDVLGDGDPWQVNLSELGCTLPIFNGGQGQWNLPTISVVYLDPAVNAKFGTAAAGAYHLDCETCQFWASGTFGGPIVAANPFAPGPFPKAGWPTEPGGSWSVFGYATDCPGG